MFTIFERLYVHVCYVIHTCHAKATRRACPRPTGKIRKIRHGTRSRSQANEPKATSQDAGPVNQVRGPGGLANLPRLGKEQWAYPPLPCVCFHLSLESTEHILGGKQNTISQIIYYEIPCLSVCWVCIIHTASLIFPRLLC